MSRRSYRYPKPGRLITFGPCLPVAAWGYANTVPSVHWAVAGALFLATLLIWPVIVVMAVFVLPCAPGLLVPRSWRKAHRRRHGREHCRSAYIPKYLRRLVYAADRGCCVYCKSQCQGSRDRQVDHFRPWSQGGMTTLGNLLTLCAYHNRIKSNYWPGVHYRALPGADNLGMAADILHREHIARLNPLRWVRVAWAIG